MWGHLSEWVRTSDWALLARCANIMLAWAEEDGLLPLYALAPTTRALAMAVAAFADPLDDAELRAAGSQLLRQNGYQWDISTERLKFVLASGSIGGFVSRQDWKWHCLITVGEIPQATTSRPRPRYDVWVEVAPAVDVDHGLALDQLRLLVGLKALGLETEETGGRLAKYIRSHPAAPLRVSPGMEQSIQELVEVNKEAGSMLTAGEAFSAGKAARQAREWPLAEAFYLRALDLRPERAYRVGLAALWAEWGYQQAAEDLYVELLDEKEEAVVLVAFASMKRKQGALSEAEQLCRRGLALHRDPVGLTILGGILREAHRANEARPVFEEALRTSLGGKRCYALSGLGAALLDLGAISDAEMHSSNMRVSDVLRGLVPRRLRSSSRSFKRREMSSLPARSRRSCSKSNASMAARPAASRKDPGEGNSMSGRAWDSPAGVRRVAELEVGGAESSDNLRPDAVVVQLRSCG
jgi:tetratricopeptide (TPR) repeat protein